LALCFANAGAEVLGRRRLRRKWLEVDALSPTGDYATDDYAAILDRVNLKDAEVLKELVRQSVVPALQRQHQNHWRVHQPSPANGGGQRPRPNHVQGQGADEAYAGRLISRYRFFVLPRFTGLPAKIKEELPAYHAAVAMIKPLEERENAEGNGTFDMEALWKSQRSDLRA
jgi:hypothetical protein